MAQQGSGLFASVKTLLGTLLGMVHTRLELLVNELEEEKLRLGKMLLYGLLALFFFGLGILLLSVLVIALFWDTHRLAAITVVAAVHLGIAFLLLQCVRELAGRKHKLFAATLAELGKDRAALEAQE
jgi:uncharacterized membrane protein YqjE